MLLTVQQDDPDSSNNESGKTDDVSEDELDMILATMGTASLKDSELAILQNDVSPEEQTQQKEIKKPQGQTQQKEIKKPEEQPEPQPAPPRITAHRVVKNFFNRLRNAK